MSAKDEVVDLNNEVERAKKRMFSLSGQRKAVMSKLREMGVNNIKSARDEIKALQIQLEKLVAKRKSLRRLIKAELEKLE